MTASRSVSTQQVPSPAPVAVAMKPSTAERAVSVSFTTPLMCLLQRVRCHLNLCFLPDIDECSARTHGCNQVCTNTPGSFQCSCTDCGFELSADGMTCTG